jgi:cyanophycinase
VSERRGYIVPIGGAEEKRKGRVVLRQFAKICGGHMSEIAVIPTASRLTETGRDYVRLFRDLKVRTVKLIDIQRRSDCEREENLRIIERADGVFMTGGDQLRLSTNIGGTRLAEAILRRNREGLHVAGTSAGAAFISTHMIAFGDDGPTPRFDMVTLCPGLGLTDLVLVDQHFRQRNRLGRLIAAISYNPKMIGLGIDEDTAAFIAPDNTLTVYGTGGITVVDPAEVDYSSMDQASQKKPISVTGLKLHVLISGGMFNLATRQATPGVALPARG